MSKLVENSRQRGFTLIELMIVILIMGLALSVVSLSIGKNDGASLTQKETEDFMLAAQFVSEQTVLNAQIIGLFMEPQAAEDASQTQWCYHWEQRRDNQWQETTDALEPHCFAEQLQVEMIVEGEPYKYDPDLTPTPPVLVFYPSGEATNFKLALYETKNGFTNEESLQRVEVDMMGNLRWVTREEADAAAGAGR